MSNKRTGSPSAAELVLLNVGHGNVVLKNRLIAMVAPNSSPCKRLIEESRQRMKLVDATQGRRVRSILVTDSDHVVLSAVALETMVQRFEGKNT
jgi:regulator of extracellular matrix RemA (YlzA/DUF370 family)